jgi:hypothetical protein
LGQLRAENDPGMNGLDRSLKSDAGDEFGRRSDRGTSTRETRAVKKSIRIDFLGWAARLRDKFANILETLWRRK